MKSMILLFPMLLALIAAQTAPPAVTYDQMVKHKTIPIYAATPWGEATIYTYGDLCVVTLGTRVIGPLATLALDIPGQQEATAGTTVCVAEFLPGGGAYIHVATYEMTSPTLGQAASTIAGQLAGLMSDPDKAVLPMSECSGGQG